jgi:hypothetical protein
MKRRGLIAWSKRPWLLAAVALSIGMVGYFVAKTFGVAGHIAWNELGPFNEKRFEAQFVADVRPGMSRAEVEAYLRREGIPFDYRESPVQPIFYVTSLGATRALLIFPGDLHIHINMTPEDRVDNVSIHIQYK